MLTGRINAIRSSRSTVPSRLMLQTCVCLLVLLGPLTHNPVEGQYLQSPCPNVFSYRFTPGTNLVFGLVELRDLPIGQFVTLSIELSIGMAVPQNHIGSITLVKSREETLRDIYSNQPAQYHVDFPFNNVIPNVLTISVNGQTICTGQKATGRIVTTVNLEHSLFTQMQLLSNGNDNNFDDIQFRPPQNWAQTSVTLAPVLRASEPVPLPGNYSSNVYDSTIECGKPTRFLNRRSLNGIRSQKGHFPWATPIFNTGPSSKPRFICGSTIITTQHLITVATCMYNSRGILLQADDLTSFPGMYNINNLIDPDLQERKVSTIIIHDDYKFEDTNDIEADIAVLKVDQPIVYNNVVRPICLWSESENLRQLVGLEGFVSGWGITEDGNAKYPSYVVSTVVDRRSCLSNLEKTLTNTSRLFCVDGNGFIPCSGDSGNGFVIKRGQKYYLRGIVSVGQFDNKTLTCVLDKYVIYTDIAPFRYWLSKVVKL